MKPALTIDEQICLLEKRGYAKGVLNTLIQLIRNGNLSLDRAAEIAAEDFLKKRGIWKDGKIKFQGIYGYFYFRGCNKTVIINICVAKARLFYYNTDKDKEY